MKKKSVLTKKIRQNNVNFAQRDASKYGINFLPREKIDAKNQCHPFNNDHEKNLSICSNNIIFCKIAVVSRKNPVFRKNATISRKNLFSQCFGIILSNVFHRVYYMIIENTILQMTHFKCGLCSAFSPFRS